MILLRYYYSDATPNDLVVFLLLTVISLLIKYSISIEVYSFYNPEHLLNSERNSFCSDRENKSVNME